MTTRARTHLARALVGLAAMVTSAAVLPACAASAGDLAKASCSHVNASLALLDRATRDTDPHEAARLRSKAYLALLSAIPIAAQAAYHDLQWEALSATLSEANRVPEAELVPSLRSQCQTADSSVFSRQPPPSTPPPG